MRKEVLRLLVCSQDGFNGQDCPKQKPGACSSQNGSDSWRMRLENCPEIGATTMKKSLLLPRRAAVAPLSLLPQAEASCCLLFKGHCTRKLV